MNLTFYRVRKTWEGLSRADARWAVLTAPERADGGWDDAAFFETGRHDVARCLALMRACRPELATKAVMDFGCGVGRLSRALAEHFEQVVGVDVAAPMIARARMENPHRGRVEYHLNLRCDLSAWASESFDVVLSLITLQHMPPKLMAGYLAEFVRVCRPEGLVCVQVPTSLAGLPPRWSWYPPTWWKRIRRGALRMVGVQPSMEMHAMSRRQLEAVLAGCGARIVQEVVHPMEVDTRSSIFLIERCGGAA